MTISEKLKLRRLKNSDKIRLSELCNNKKIWNNLRDYIPSPYSEKDAEIFIKHSRKENPIKTFAIEYNKDFIGCISLVRQADVYKLTAEIGYWIGEPYWGHGYATKAVNLIVDYGFKKLGVLRIHTGVIDFNKASQRVLEKAGFKLECIFEKSIYKNGTICNEYRYAKINESYGQL